jgi:hypothetical protein
MVGKPDISRLWGTEPKFVDEFLVTPFGDGILFTGGKYDLT